MHSMTDINSIEYNIENGYWYGSSARPVFGLWIKDVKQIVTLTNRISASKPYFDMVETNSRMPDSEVYSYELTPLSANGWLEVDIKEFELVFADSDTAKYLLSMPISEIHESVYHYIKSVNRFANGRTIPGEQVEAITSHLLQIADKVVSTTS